MAARPSAACVDCRDLFIVAHQDDDLLFMNPDLSRRIAAGGQVRTVFLTAGDADRPQAYWSMREQGIEAAYAQMAGVANEWSAVAEGHAGKQVLVRRLDGAPRVSVVLLRLPNSWSEHLERLYDGLLPELATVDGANVFTRQQLIDTLGSIVGGFGPSLVGTLDATTAFGEDHSDHRASARFAFHALQAIGKAGLLRSYRGYNISGEKVDLATADHAAKQKSFSIYAAFDDAICTIGQQCAGSEAYQQWQWRRYAVSAIADVHGQLGTTGGRCLSSAGAGQPASLVQCASASRWAIASTGEVVDDGGRCLTLGASDDASSVAIASCDGGLSQRWVAFDNGQLRAPDGRCLDSAVGAPIQLGVAACAAKASQIWTARFGAVAMVSSGGQFGDSQLGADPSYWATVRFGDIDGDGLADACARKTDGVHCARGSGGGFAPTSRFITEFSDALGWNNLQYGGTLALGDVSGDGKADVCARGVEGIICAVASTGGTAFVQPKVWSQGGAFSDAAGFAKAQSYYGSIRLGDVDGDGYADVCGRSKNGVVCAINTRSGSLGTAQPWLDIELTDAYGWLAPQYGSTLQLGDIDGDGRADVCARGVAGLICAVARKGGPGFHNPANWSYGSDFSDSTGWAAAASYYGSIRLADVNGDGRADACGRGPGGVVCGLSDGASFARALPVLPHDFTDALGWAADRYGTTLRFADLDGDGHADVCGRGTYGLLCAAAP